MEHYNIHHKFFLIQINNSSKIQTKYKVNRKKMNLK